MAKNKKSIDLKNQPTNKEIVGLFRHLWIQSIDGKNYNREEWKKMEEMLDKKGIKI